MYRLSQVLLLFAALQGVAYSAEESRWGGSGHWWDESASAAEAKPAAKGDEYEKVLLDASQLPPVAAEADGDYRIGPHDLIEIDVFQAPELKRTVRVNSRGYISLPLVGAMEVAGMTASELEGTLASVLGEKYLQDPQASVFIREYTSQRVTMEGWVKKPGVYALKGQTTLLQAIAMAEGLEDLADAENVVLFRPAGDGEFQGYRVDLEKVRNGEARDPVIQGDDRIIVQKSGSRSVIKDVTDTIRGIVSFGAL